MTEHNDMNQPTRTEDGTQSNAPEYGRLLTQARESKGLTIDQVASQLRLSAKQIIGMETGDPGAFASVVYTRAHLRSYARLLGIDEAKIISGFNSTLNIEDRDQKAFIKKTTSGLRPYKEETTKYGKGRGIGWLIFLIVLGILAYTGWEYTNRSFDMQKVKASLGFADESKQQIDEMAAAEREKVLAAENEKKAQEQKDEKTETKSEDANAAKEDKNGVKQLGTTPEEKALEEKVMAEHAQKLEEEKKAQEAKNAEAATSEPAAPRLLELVQNENGWQTTLPGVKTGEPVNIKFTATEGECWFGVYLNGKLVDNVTLKQGQERNFVHPLPFRVTVGNKFRAIVTLNGNPVNLTGSSRSGSVSFQVYPEK